MAHIRFDDKRIELSAGGVGIGTAGEAIVPIRAARAKGILAIIIVDPSCTPMSPHPRSKVASTSANCPTARRNNAVVSKEARTAPTLEADNGGTSRRRVAPLCAALAHIGRGERNNVIVADDTVSASHARIQRRESGWFVVDMLSTNGSYASGKRAPGEEARKADPAVRFGCMKVIFRSEPESVDADGGPREFVEFKLSEQWRAPSARPSLS